jgi:hypothetical protein
MQGGFVETLGDLRQNGMGLYAHCIAPNTGHGSPLDLDALIARLGPDHVYINDRRLASAMGMPTLRPQGCADHGDGEHQGQDDGGKCNLVPAWACGVQLKPD